MVPMLSVNMRLILLSIFCQKKLTNRHYFLPKGGLATPKFQMAKNNYNNNNIKGLTDRGWLNHP
jgi:hypothetical protein